MKVMNKKKLYENIDKEKELSDKDKKEIYLDVIEYEKQRQEWVEKQ